jgi:DNA-directed RNA polymerase specialized sigma24 family protein
MDYVDFFALQDGEQKIDRRLKNWAMYVRPKRGYGSVHPMFRWYRPTEVWNSNSKSFSIDLPDAELLEKAMRNLSPVNRIALKWFYVENTSPTKVCKILKVNLQTLKDFVSNGRKQLQSYLDVA